MRHITQLLLGVGVIASLTMAPCYATVQLEPDSPSNTFAPRVIDVSQQMPRPQHHFFNRSTLPLPPSPDNVNTAPIDNRIAMATVPAATMGYPAAMNGPIPTLMGMISRSNPGLSPDEVRNFAQSVNYSAAANNVDARLLAGLVSVESSFRTTAVSSTGAIGLGQLKPDTARWLGVNDPYDPNQNLMGCAKYLRYLLDHYQGNVPSALAAYFQGQGTIDRIGINPDAAYYIGKVSRVLGVN